MDGIIDDIRGGSANALTGLMLGAMFVIAGVYLFRRV